MVGASSGIGLGIGLGLSRAGADVAFAARRVDRLERAVAECSARAAAIGCDVRDPESCVRVVQRTVEALGGLDALVYTAGTTAFVEAAKATADDWWITLGTNLVGAAIVTAAARTHLAAARGHAIYLSSNSARFYSPWRGLGLYTASKRGLESLVQSLRLENPEIAFTTLVAGPTASEFGRDAGEDAAEFGAEWYRKEQVTGPGLLEPADHARVVLEILTSEPRTLVSEVVVEPR